MSNKQSSKKRTQIKDLPKKEKKLSAAEAKSVKGGGAKGGNVEFEWKVEEGESAPTELKLTTKR